MPTARACFVMFLWRTGEPLYCPIHGVTASITQTILSCGLAYLYMGVAEVLWVRA